jgi:hypothetical protein
MLREKRIFLYILFILFAFVVCLLLIDGLGNHPLQTNLSLFDKSNVDSRSVGGHTVSTRVEQYGASARKRLAPYFKRVSQSYPPERIALLGFKQEKTLELWARQNNRWSLIKRYPLTAYSGVLGPKLREGDKQIPEGIYKIIGLNPNSSYHLSMKLDYPNEFDLHFANKEKRFSPGSNIFIHGRNASIGCLAIGDPGIEELFVLTSDTGKENVEVIVAPYDMRKLGKTAEIANRPEWVPILYRNLRETLSRFKTVNNKQVSRN